MRYIVCGGGTGGHVYPALAVCEALREIDGSAQILYLGTSSGFEAKLVPAAGVEFVCISSGGVAGKSLARALRGAAAAYVGLAQSLGIVGKFQPHVALGTGGYVSGPALLACWLRGVPVSVQEQNVYPGLTNKLLARISTRVFVAFPESVFYFPPRVVPKMRVTGNPIRKAILNAERGQGHRLFGTDSSLLTVVVFGGSRGAKPLVMAALQVASKLRHRQVQFIVVTGERLFDEATQFVEASGIAWSKGGNVILRPYVEQMDLAYSVADIVVSRAGALTVSELAATGIPSLLVPSPYVANRHQEHNAKVLAERGAAMVLTEGPDLARELGEKLDWLLSHPREREQMGQKARQVAKPRAARTIAEELFRLAERRACACIS
ncbi:MAG: undecaprenyldiphospho-muramoylpentapeptide beta-N-acetylglucosaminyltransferase [Bacillota bacterium]